MVTRAEALEAATKIVDDLAPRTNARGYTDSGVVQPDKRLDLILRTADWLLGSARDEH